MMWIVLNFSVWLFFQLKHLRQENGWKGKGLRFKRYAEKRLIILNDDQSIGLKFVLHGFKYAWK